MTRALPGPTPSRLPARIAKMPRWALVLCAVAVAIPTIVGVVFVVIFGVTVLLILLAAALVVAGILALFWKFHHRVHAAPGASTQIVVHSSRVIDP